MLLIKTRNILLLALWSGVLLLGSIRATPSQASTTDVNAPVGTYQVSVSVPSTVSAGQAFNMTVKAAVTGINQSALWHNTTQFEGIESISISLVEAGICREKIMSTTMITNTNVSLTQPMPVYIINVTSVEHVFTFNSSFLDLGAHLWVVTIKGFRWAWLGLAIGYSNFYIQTEGTISITSEPTLDKPTDAVLTKIAQLNSTIEDMRRQITTMMTILYSAVAIALVGIVIGAVGIIIARKKS